MTTLKYHFLGRYTVKRKMRALLGEMLRGNEGVACSADESQLQRPETAETFTRPKLRRHHLGPQDQMVGMNPAMRNPPGGRRYTLGKAEYDHLDSVAIDALEDVSVQGF